MLDGNSWYERVTDAGTKPLIEIPPHVDDIPYDEDFEGDDGWDTRHYPSVEGEAE